MGKTPVWDSCNANLLYFCCKFHGKPIAKKVLKLDAQAQALLDQERQRINMLKCPGGPLFEQQELCAKAPDNIVRIAAILHAFSNGMGDISGQTMLNAIEICIFLTVFWRKPLPSLHEEVLLSWSHCRLAEHF